MLLQFLQQKRKKIHRYICLNILWVHEFLVLLYIVFQITFTVVMQPKAPPSKVSSMFSGTIDKCRACNKTVYPLEKVWTLLVVTISYEFNIRNIYSYFYLCIKSCIRDQYCFTS